MSVPNLYHIRHPTRRPLGPRARVWSLALQAGPLAVLIIIFQFHIFLRRAPVGGSDFACMFGRFLMATWALSLVPIMAMSVRNVTSHDRRWAVGLSRTSVLAIATNCSIY